MRKIAPQKVFRSGDIVAHKPTGLLVVINSILKEDGSRVFSSTFSKIKKFSIMDHEKNIFNINKEFITLRK